MIPPHKINEMNYPCKTEGSLLKLFTFSIISLLTLLLCIKSYKSENFVLCALLPVLLLSVFFIYNVILVCYDFLWIIRIIRVLECENSVLMVGDYLVFGKKRMIHFLLRQRPEILLLIAKILESYYKVKKDMIGIDKVNKLIKIAIQYDSDLMQISEISDVSVVGKRISKLLPLKPSGRIFLLLVVFCKVILYLLLFFLAMSVLLIVIGFILRRCV